MQNAIAVAVALRTRSWRRLNLNTRDAVLKSRLIPKKHTMPNYVENDVHIILWLDRLLPSDADGCSDDPE